MVSNCDLESESSTSASAFLYPDNIYFPHISLDKVEEFVNNNLVNQAAKESAGEYPMVLVCGHKSRDQRCGIIAPLLVDEFTKVLGKNELLYNKQKNPNGIRVTVCSHVGGHAFAGNVIYHDGKKGSLPVWYSSVFPYRVQGIVKETILNNRIIAELNRQR